MVRAHRDLPVAGTPRSQRTKKHERGSYSHARLSVQMDLLYPQGAVRSDYMEAAAILDLSPRMLSAVMRGGAWPTSWKLKGAKNPGGPGYRVAIDGFIKDTDRSLGAPPKPPPLPRSGGLRGASPRRTMRDRSSTSAARRPLDSGSPQPPVRLLHRRAREGPPDADGDGGQDRGDSTQADQATA